MALQLIKVKETLTEMCSRNTGAKKFMPDSKFSLLQAKTWWEIQPRKCLIWSEKMLNS